jgi:Tfp pilus assembly protein PilO
MASGMVADFARMPTQRKVLVFVLIGTLLGLLYWKLVYKNLDEDLDAAQVEHDNKAATNRRLAAEIPAYEELRTHMTRLKELIDKNQTALPSAAESPAFFETLRRKATEAGATLIFTTKPEEPVENFIKVPAEVRLTGTFMQIKRFFASLIQRDARPGPGEDRASAAPERIVSVENLALTNPEVKNHEIVLTARFTAVTFRQEDRPAPGQPAGSPPAGARPASPPAPVTAPPPLPSTAPPPLPSTAPPAGAKGRVDNAVEKGDARDRKAAGDATATGAQPAGARPAAGGDRLKGGL